ncbi:MAG: MotA/TolQ/ExbB proton channel family protein [Akkermansiaceae bacterium]|nr:MotA/TolQ/ExbB proton channel family protein [Akkermansiaceae bacterium]
MHAFPFALAVDPAVNQKIWDFLLSGGIFMAFIAVCSFIALTVAIHRFISLRRGAVIPARVMDHIDVAERYIFHGAAADLRERLEESDTPLGRIGRLALSPAHLTREEAAAAVEVTAREEVVKLQTGLAALEVVITIAPMLGLLGTVSGLVSVFAELGRNSDASDPSAIAAGIAEALNTTIAGLVVAVMTVIVHSYLNKRIEAMAARLEVVIGHLLNLYFRFRDRAERGDDEPASAEVEIPGPGDEGEEVGT